MDRIRSVMPAAEMQSNPLEPQELTMAKGQVRSNRETRKPKKDKVAASAAPTLGSQVKQAGSTDANKKQK